MGTQKYPGKHREGNNDTDGRYKVSRAGNNHNDCHSPTEIGVETPIVVQKRSTIHEKHNHRVLEASEGYTQYRHVRKALVT